ncbi:hypothetical protein TrST_g13138 [Triparma strigata]|uniref:Pseudouridine synthase I TruA alpha/beta domain-containing protein n=1 Tax=Triparma strigata TaxID=1606541 RepID=A0A9W7F285_9STRA|nr:hypothetical protein TrST_g13138 [Triparma strigata]
MSTIDTLNISTLAAANKLLQNLVDEGIVTIDQLNDKLKQISQIDNLAASKAAPTTAASSVAVPPPPTKKQKPNPTPDDQHPNQRTNPPTSKKEKKKPRPFTLSNKRQRHIALRISYDGSSYGGFSENVGEAYDNSVEKFLFIAFIKTRLIVDRKSCSYGRCGRTDKGVSSSGQIINLYLRSVIPKGEEYDDKVPEYDEEVEIEVKDEKGNVKKKIIKELDYVKILNGVLPPSILVQSWSPVTPSFSSRFSCTSRTYRYFFISTNLNLSQMSLGLEKIIGDHDFRNIAKMDTEHVSNFRRVVYEAGIKGEGTVRYFEIKGQAFLWHMVRNIVQVMFFIGKGLESPSIVDSLFDVSKMPRKPNYKMAADYPLVLHKCDFKDLRMKSSAMNLWEVQMNLEGRWERLAIMAEQLRNQIESLGEENSVSIADLWNFKNTGLSKWRRVDPGVKAPDIDCPWGPDSQGTIKWKDALTLLHSKEGVVISGVKEPPHVPLSSRPTGMSYEEKIESMKGKKLERYKEAKKKGKSKEVDKEFYRSKQSQGSSSK